MSYCVNCGVELDPSAGICPLCHTPVCNPVQPVDTGDKIRLAARPVLGLEQIWQPAALGRFGEDPGRLDTDEKLPVFIDDGDGRWRHGHSSRSVGLETTVSCPEFASIGLN